jgi:D-alanyl-D-alanine carboxypeptidase
MKKYLCIVITILMLISAVACHPTGSARLDYLVLVNKENKLPDGWELALDTVRITNSVGDEVETERAAYDAYLKLSKALEDEGIHVELDSAYRSVAAQQKIVDDFTKKYGEDYVKQYVAVPGYSEHHTGLALDLYLIVDKKTVYENEDLVTYPDIWAKIHEKLAAYGFILRYLEGKENITGYNYEPWHIRYVGSESIAKQITDKGITLEEYLDRLPKTDVAPPAE